MVCVRVHVHEHGACACACGDRSAALTVCKAEGEQVGDECLGEVVVDAVGLPLA